MRVSRGCRLGTKALPRSHTPWGFWLKGGEGPPLPSKTPPSWFLFPFPGNELCKGGGGKGRVGEGEQGGSSEGWGGRACEEGAIPVPSALLPALSHGVLEKGAGWPDWLARPWGQREGPRPARGAARLRSPLLPSPPASPGRECLVPAAPSLGPEGRAGRAASYPLLLLPTSSPPRCEPEPPPPLPPLTHAAPGLAGRWAWDRVRGWGEPCGERASRRPLVAVPCAGERPRRPLTGNRLGSPYPCHRGVGAYLLACLAAGKVACAPAGERAPSHFLACRARGAPCPAPSLRIESTPSVHSLFCWSCGNLV